MRVFGTEMELITFIFTLFESLIFFYQFIYYLSRPQDQRRLLYLILLLIMILYNVTGGLFPDKNIDIPIILQNIIAYSTGFAVGCYIPYYFYKAYGLQRLRFHALYGIYIFLIFPFILFFVLEYSLNGNLEMARHRGVVIPFFWALTFIYVIFKEVIRKLREDMSTDNIINAIIVCLACLPWSSMPLMAYMNVTQVTEVTVCNGGFLIMSIIFVRQSIVESKAEFQKLQQLTLAAASPAQRFQENCIKYGLSPREIDIVKLIDEGLIYKLIGEKLFISERTINKHVQNIYKKVGVSQKVNLINKLYE